MLEEKAKAEQKPEGQQAGIAADSRATEGRSEQGALSERSDSALSKTAPESCAANRQREERQHEERKIVLPGEVVDEGGRMKPGQGVFKEGDRIYASQIGIASTRGDYVNVVSFKGTYEPRAGDFIIAKVMEYGPSNWVMDINSPYVGMLSADSVPWRVEIGETGRFLGVGDMIVSTIAYVDGCKKIGVSMRDRDARKITSGIVLRISPSKIPRLIGKAGSMVAMIKKYTNTRIFAGQNGRIWIDGTPEGIAVASNVIKMIDCEAHTHGLTDRVEAYLKQNSCIPVSETKPAGQHAAPAAHEKQESGTENSGLATRAADSESRIPGSDIAKEG